MGLFTRKKNQPTDQHYATMNSLEECLKTAKDSPFFILKHSTTCPISTAAKNEMDRFLNKNPATAYLVIVQQQRALSNDIAQTFNISHESPQALYIQDGQVKAVFNHYEINEDNLKNVD